MYVSRKGIKILPTKTKTSKISKVKYGNGGEMIWQILQFNAWVFIPTFISQKQTTEKITHELIEKKDCHREYLRVLLRH